MNHKQLPVGPFAIKKPAPTQPVPMQTVASPKTNKDALFAKFSSYSSGY